jgi:hypothetical protein
VSGGLFGWTRDMFRDNPGPFSSYYIDLAQSGCVIHHPDRNFKEILNLAMEIENSINNTCYGYICSIATLQENVTSPNGII